MNFKTNRKQGVIKLKRIGVIILIIIASFCIAGVISFKKIPQSNSIFAIEKGSEKLRKIVAKENSGLAYDIYSFGISKIFVRVKNNERRVRLENAIIQGKITMDEILNEAEKDVKSGKAMYDVYQDGGTRIYVYEDYTIIKANRLDGNKNVYIVPKDVFWGDFPTE